MHQLVPWRRERVTQEINFFFWTTSDMKNDASYYTFRFTIAVYPLQTVTNEKHTHYYI